MEHSEEDTFNKLRQIPIEQMLNEYQEFFSVINFGNYTTEQVQAMSEKLLQRHGWTLNEFIKNNDAECEVDYYEACTIKESKQVSYWEVKEKLHIFLLGPEFDTSQPDILKAKYEKVHLDNGWTMDEMSRVDRHFG